MSGFGVAVPVGRLGVERLLEIAEDEDEDEDEDESRVPEEAWLCLDMLMDQLVVVKQQVLENDRRVLASARQTKDSYRLMEIPGVGPLLVSAFAASAVHTRPSW